MEKQYEKHIFLTAPGGMGKTTAMFRTMLEQTVHYSPMQPAVAYVSLYGWRDSGSTYIRDRILENLHFKPDMTNYEDARHALQYLMKVPYQMKNGKKYPILVIFIDGLNEASGETQPLLDEIIELSHLEGVKLLVSSRTETQIEGFDYWKLVSLQAEEVNEILSSRGLLVPKSQQMCELLRIPLMLSMFLEASSNEEKQISVGTQEELVQSYFDSLMEKEMRDLEDNMDFRWQMDVAIYYVLPAIASELQKKHHDLDDAQLFPIVEKCYRLFASVLLKNAFPKWIGRSKAILGTTSNAEEWYGLIVHDILWYRFGLLVKNEQGNYQTIHQIIEDYLIEQNRQNQKRIWRRKRLKWGITIGVLIFLLTSGTFVYINYIAPQPYSKEFAQPVIYMGVSAYSNVAKQYENVRALLDCAIEKPLEYDKEFSLYKNKVDYLSLNFNSILFSEELLEDMLNSGEVMPWSKQKFDEEQYKKLLYLAEDRKEEYEQCVNVLTYLMENESLKQRYGEEYCELFDQLIETDAQISSILYQIVCYRDVTILCEEDEMDKIDLESIMQYNYLQNEHLPKETEIKVLHQSLITLEGKRKDIYIKMQSGGAWAKYNQIIGE